MFSRISLASYIDAKFVLFSWRGGTLKPQPVIFCAWVKITAIKKNESTAILFIGIIYYKCKEFIHNKTSLLKLVIKSKSILSTFAHNFAI
ncbi:hypothetical protein CAP36_08875 [Chitinophagaceae bacterium IBVUCB2]|nr:hypothetical protein CAP36_08875 [Chitinophagaceae bacterium IBVUCB2]